MRSALSSAVGGETKRIIVSQIVATIGALIVNLLAVRVLSPEAFLTLRDGSRVDSDHRERRRVGLCWS